MWDSIQLWSNRQISHHISHYFHISHTSDLISSINQILGSIVLVLLCKKTPSLTPNLTTVNPKHKPWPFNHHLGPLDIGKYSAVVEHLWSLRPQGLSRPFLYLATKIKGNKPGILGVEHSLQNVMSGWSKFKNPSTSILQMYVSA